MPPHFSGKTVCKITLHGRNNCEWTTNTARMQYNRICLMKHPCQAKVQAAFWELRVAEGAS